MKWPKYTLPIEKYALLTETAPDLRGRLDEWFGFYLPASPGERELLEISVMSSVQGRRVLDHLTTTVNDQIRTAVLDFDRRQEDQVEYYRGLLDSRPGAALVGLRRSALGCRFLIERWERLGRLLEQEGTWFGNDRNEAIQYQGAIASTDHLFDSEGAYLTWLYCILAQPAPKDEDIIAMGNEAWMPRALNDRDTSAWLPPRPVCRTILEELVERELADLRPRAERLRVAYEQPARDGAEARRQVVEGPHGALMLRHVRLHELQFHRAYHAFLQGRQETARTGRPPGAPDPAHQTAKDESTCETNAADHAAADAGPEPAREAAAQRRREAEAVAANAANGIGAPVVRGDALRAGARAARAAMEQEETGSADAGGREEVSRGAAEGAEIRDRELTAVPVFLRASAAPA